MRRIPEWNSLFFDGHFLCLKQCVPKAPYHSPVRCRIVRRLDGELIRARGSPNHRGTGYIASFANRQKHVERTASKTIKLIFIDEYLICN